MVAQPQGRERIIAFSAKQTADPEVGLREGNLDARGVQGVSDRPGVGRMHRCGSLDRLRAGPDQKLEVQAAVAEPDQPDLALSLIGLRHGEGRGVGGGQHRLAHLCPGRAVGDGKGNVDATGVALQRPIGDRTLDQMRVGDDDVDVVIGADTRGPGADLGYRAARPAFQFDIISH
ncbi:hypothetical protein D3C72_894090 [compost metagenome]